MRALAASWVGSTINVLAGGPGGEHVRRRPMLATGSGVCDEPAGAIPAQAQRYRELAEAIDRNEMFVIPKPVQQEELEKILIEYGMLG